LEKKTHMSYTNCFVSFQNRCAIVCQDADNEETWVDVNDAVIPDKIRKDYERCRKNQLSSFKEALEIKSQNSAPYVHTRNDEPTFTRKKTRKELEEFMDNESLETIPITRQKRQTTLCKDDPKVLEKITNYEDTKSKILQILQTFKDVKFVRLVGEGLHGTVFEICNPELSSQRFIVKIGIGRKEFKMQQVFYEHGLAVEPIGFVENVFVMGKIDGILSDLLEEEQPTSVLDNIVVGLIDLITRMTDSNLIHMDLHFGNIGYQINIETRVIHFVLLDFESGYFGASATYELRQLRESCSSIKNPQNQRYLCDKLYNIPFRPGAPFRYSHKEEDTLV